MRTIHSFPLALAAKASTPAEHRALEEYFQTLAKRGPDVASIR